MNEQASHPVIFVGILGISEEEHCLALLYSSTHRRFLPIWLGFSAATSLCITANSPWGAGPPSASETLWEKLDSSPDRICSLHIDSHNEGVFLAHALCDSGEHLDLKTSDLLRMSIECDVEILVNEDCLMQSGLRMTAENVRDLCDSKFVQAAAREALDRIIQELEDDDHAVADAVPPGESGGNSDLDRDFEALMGNLGLEEELFGHLADDFDKDSPHSSPDDTSETNPSTDDEDK